MSINIIKEVEGSLKASGTSLESFIKTIAYPKSTVLAALKGRTNGKKSKEIREIFMDLSLPKLTNAADRLEKIRDLERQERNLEAQRTLLKEDTAS